MALRHQEVVETRIDVADLEIGMHVIRLDRPWEETDFLMQGFVIQNRSELQALQAQCHFVFIEGRVEQVSPVARPEQPARKGFSLFGKSRKATAPPAKAPAARSTLPRKRVNYINKVSMTEELAPAVMRFEEARETAKSLMAGLRLGRTLDLNHARQVVNSCVDSILRNENALLLLTKIKNQDEYTAEHCINVSILSAAFGKHLGLLEGEIRNLALCGLLHDVGKTRIPDRVLNKPGALTPDEFSIMREHTIHGRSILMGTSNALASAVDVAFSHHERMDGSGYPRGLESHQIPLFAKLVGLVDTYDAITSNRIYDKGRASMQALDIIHKHRGTQFDTELAEAFIQMIGVYPPGSIVEMHNGEVGIVVETRPGHKLKPKVLLVREAGKTQLEPYRLIDLMTSPDDHAGATYRIKNEVPDGSFDIILQDFVDQGLISNKPSQPAP